MNDKSFEEYIKSKWKSIDVNEFKSYLACIFLMGIINKPAFEDYWNQKVIVQETPSFHHIMSFDDFLKMLVIICVKIQSHQSNHIIFQVAILSVK